MVYHTEEELYKKKEMKIKPILSVLPYLTEIVGQLYEAKNYDYLKYILLPADATELYFVKQGDKIIASNLSKKYFQIIDYKVASYFNDIIIAIYQFYEYLQTKNIIKEVPFNYQYYLKKEILHHRTGNL